MSFDIFISFRSGDTRSNRFTEQLYMALVESGISTFMDDKKLLINEDRLSESLTTKIENSRSFIVVLSENYASSKWCLRELRNIMDYCMAERRFVVVPVFYHVNPSEVRRQSGSFGKSFHKHEEFLGELGYMERVKYMTEIEQWRRDLTRVADFAGFVVPKENRNEMDIIDKIIDRGVEMLLDRKLISSNRFNKLVDIECRLLKMDELIDLESNEVRFVMLIGMGGIGKTTIAEMFYHNTAYKFGKNYCFLRVYEHNTLLSLQQQLLSEIVESRDVIIKNENEGGRMIESCLKDKKVFIVLDGMKEKNGGWLEKLVESFIWCGEGSIIIITTRNRDVFRCSNYYKVKIVEYNVEFLDYESSMELFCKYAFKRDVPDENFEDLTEEIVEIVKGHPLALESIGSFLYCQSKDKWKQVLNDEDLLGRILYIDILRTGYEELDDESKHIFLDLVCFFNGERVEVVMKILEAIYDDATIDRRLELLEDRSLIQFVEDEIQIHFLILCMGRKIVRDHMFPPRICNRDDVSRIFQDKNVLDKIHGIKVVDHEDQDEELELDSKSFSYMRDLKLLEISNVKLSQNHIEFLSNQLRRLKWPEFPLRRFPSNFHPRFMVQLILPQSKLETLWEGTQHLEYLKEIDARESKYLMATPDFSNAPNLERLILRNCSRLKEIHPSIRNMSGLVYLDLEGCVSLTTFPSDIICCSTSTSPSDQDIVHHISNLTYLNLNNCTQLSSLPTSIGSLTSLTTLNLNGCKNLAQIPPSLWTLNSLVQLDIGGTLVKLPPSSFAFSMQKLQIINLEKLYGSIWISFTSLITSNRTTYGPHYCIIRDLNLSNCNLVDEDIPHDLTSFSALEILDLSGNHFVTLSQSLTQLINLKALNLNRCNKLKQLPNQLPTSLRYVGGLDSLHLLPNNSSGSSATSSTLLSKYPLMVKEYTSESETNINKLMEQPKSSNLVGMEEQVEKVTKLLDLENNNEVIFLGIFGISGIGKTSLARVVYEKIAPKFESSCFLHIPKKSNLASLQHQLLSQLLLSKAPIKVGDVKINNFGDDDDQELIRNHLNGKKVVIVIDGVDENNNNQIQKLIRGLANWFSDGSRVIITSSNRKVVHSYEQHKMVEYNVALLDEAAAFQLFSKHAFRNDAPPPNQQELFKNLSHQIVRKLERLPLALKGIGSFLYNKDIHVWEETLMKLSQVEQDFLTTISSDHQKLKDSTLGTYQPSFNLFNYGKIIVPLSICLLTTFLLWYFSLM